MPKANLTPDKNLASRPTLPPSARDSRTSTSDDTWAATEEARKKAYKREDFLSDLELVSRHITNEINKDPKEVAKLRKSIGQMREGKTTPWRKADDDT